MRILLLFVITMVIIVSCRNNDFKKYGPGLEYKIISYAQAPLVQPGETIKMHVKQVYNDSVLSDTRDSLPFYQVYDSAQLSRDAYDIFAQVRTGDSVIFKALSDSAFKNKWPAFAKKGEYLFTHVTIIDILGARENWRDDLQKEINKKRK